MAARKKTKGKRYSEGENTPLSPLSDPYNGALKRPTQKANP
jgi:hypothetical protein